jgi:hypothetical protein
MEQFYKLKSYVFIFFFFLFFAAWKLKKVVFSLFGCLKKMLLLIFKVFAFLLEKRKEIYDILEQWQNGSA